MNAADPNPSSSERRPSTEPQPESTNRGAWGIVGAGLLLLLAKGKSLLILLKALPFGKLLLSTGSMCAMVALEATRAGWLFALGFVVLILVHELGHGYAMRKHGIEAGWPIFIPFFGAMIAMKQAPRDRNVEAAIAYGGPYAGTAASLVAAAIGLQTHSRLFLSLAYSGFFLNLFNMTPMSPLDGGRIAQAFSRNAWIIGLVLMGVLLLTTGSPQLILILLLGLPQALRKGTEQQRETLEPAARRTWAWRYFGLCAFLAIGIAFSGQLMHR